MYVAVFTAHLGAFNVYKGGMEYALSMAVLFTALIFTGPGMFSVDGIVFGRCCRGKKEAPPAQKT